MKIRKTEEPITIIVTWTAGNDAFVAFLLNIPPPPAPPVVAYAMTILVVLDILDIMEHLDLS
eukprot:scaffold9516_cov92-Cylindrotheca_fusiformis.AAC.2